MTEHSSKPVKIQDVEIPSDIYLYLTDILEKSSSTDLDQETRDEMICQMYLRLDKFILSRIIEALPTEDDYNTFKKMHEEKKSQEEVNAFLEEKIPHVTTLMEHVFIEFRKLYVTEPHEQKN